MAFAKERPVTLSRRPEDNRPEYYDMLPFSRPGVEENAIKVTLYHNKGQKGYTLSFLPVTRKEGRGFSFMMFRQGEAQSIRHNVMSAPRFSEKTLDELGAKFAPVVAKVVEVWNKEGRDKALAHLSTYLTYGETSAT
jgi:hypothetical protein